MQIFAFATDPAPNQYFERLPNRAKTISQADWVIVGCSTDWRQEAVMLALAKQLQKPLALLVETAGAHRRVPTSCQAEMQHFLAADLETHRQIQQDHPGVPCTVVGNVMTSQVTVGARSLAWKERLLKRPAVVWLSSSHETDSLRIAVESLPVEWALIPCLHPDKGKRPDPTAIDMITRSLVSEGRLIAPPEGMATVEVAIATGRAVGTWSQTTITAAANSVQVVLVKTEALRQQFQLISPGAKAYPGEELGLPTTTKTFTWPGLSFPSSEAVRQSLVPFQPERVIDALQATA